MQEFVNVLQENQLCRIALSEEKKTVSWMFTKRGRGKGNKQLGQMTHDAAYQCDGPRKKSTPSGFFICRLLLSGNFVLFGISQIN